MTDARGADSELVSVREAVIDLLRGLKMTTVFGNPGSTELLLAMTRRVPVADTGIEMFGDDAVWQKWLDRTPL